MKNKVLIVDFGSQFTQLIARRVRELNILSQIHSYNSLTNVSDYGAVIFSGSPHSVLQTDAPQIDLSLFDNVPVLAICYGAQYVAQKLGGKVESSKIREYGRAKLDIKSPDKLFENITTNSQVWMSHSDTIKKLPAKAQLLSSSYDVSNVAFKIDEKKIYGLQFHPEVYHTSEGTQILKNFLTKIAKLKQDWTPNNFSQQIISQLKDKLNEDKVILGLSGGVDSTVAAVLLDKAIGENLHCIFVNNGLLRKNEYETVLNQYKNMSLNVKGIDASEIFISALKGVEDPEKKRKIIGATFIDVFDNEAKKTKNIKWLGQGTIYPDVIESISVNGPSATIKSHHNVGGLPDYMNLKIVEPLRMLFKDEVRRVGESLGISQELLGRHPFPGPGLAVRILGDITKEKIRILQEVDSIFINALKNEGLYNSIWQAGAILLPINSVGVMGDERTYEKCVALRAVESVDGMTADWSHLPHRFLQNVSNDIINKVKGVNRVVYDISSKPPSTIEWE